MNIINKNQDIEIEAKFEVLDINLLKLWLNKYAKRISKKRVIDIYFVSPHKNFLKYKFPYEWLRLRDEGDKFTINYKHWYPENLQRTTHCDEFETTIGSIESLKKIFTALGFKEIAIVDKYRQNFRIDDMELSFDNVKGLGYFLEIEYKGEEIDIELINKKFSKYQHHLTTALGKRNYRGYPYLILEKNKLLPRIK